MSAPNFWVRQLFVLGLILAIFQGIREPLNPVPIELHFILFEVLTFVFLTVVLPLFLARPRYGRSMLQGEFFPVSRTRPVWLFWLALLSFVYHTTLSARIVFGYQTLDFSAFRVALTGVWLWLVQRGKFRKWNPEDARE